MNCNSIIYKIISTICWYTIENSLGYLLNFSELGYLEWFVYESENNERECSATAGTGGLARRPYYGMLVKGQRSQVLYFYGRAHRCFE